MATRLPTYRGFSTANFLRTGSFLNTNVDTVKQDLLNHIYTVPGERVHMPDFGTRIPLLAFEPMDETTVTIIREDLQKVFAYDPRVQLIDMAITPIPDNNFIAVFVDLLYVEFNIKETLKLEFGVGS
jgi:phage baseplate assembly protein W